MPREPRYDRNGLLRILSNSPKGITISTPADKKALHNFYKSWIAGDIKDKEGNVRPLEPSLEAKYIEGNEGYYNGYRLDHNPYSITSPSHFFWREGWILGINEQLFPERVTKNGSKSG